MGRSDHGTGKKKNGIGSHKSLDRYCVIDKKMAMCLQNLREFHYSFI